MQRTLLPIAIISGFNLVTLLMYIASPYVFRGEHVVLSYFYVLLNIVALTAGYYAGTRHTQTPRSGTDRRDVRYFGWVTVFYALTFLIKYAYLLRFAPLDVRGMVEQLLIGIADPKLGYVLAVDSHRTPTVGWSTYFFVSAVDGVYFALGFLVWRGLGLSLRLIFLIFLGIEVFYWAGRGTNFGIISLLVTLLLATLINTKGVIRFRLLLRYAILAAASVATFSAIMYARSYGPVENPQVFALHFSYVDEGSPILQAVPPALHTTVLTIFNYVVQGYYYMSLAFDLDFRFSLFGGWNPSLTSLYSTFGVDVAPLTYIERLDGIGVDPRINWHSAYTWIANDFSFYGVPFVIFMIGYFIGVAWLQAINSGKLVAKIVFVFLSASAIFFFANNNYIAYYFYSFIFIFPYWLYISFFKSHRRRGRSKGAGRHYHPMIIELKSSRSIGAKS
jgi:hypothetical protein